MVDEELRTRIIDLLNKSKKKIGAREIADGLGLEHRVVKKAISEMANDGTLEFESFGGATFIKLGQAQ
jgi:DNA-binding GntR family transcriptional regulator